MRVNNSIITGIFQFKEGITYTIGDIILYESVLYIVLSDYIDNKTPDRTSSCILYTDYISDPKYIEVSDDSTIVTGASLRRILRQYFRGLGTNGVLEKVTIKSRTDELDRFKDTGSYECEIIANESEGLNLILPGRYILNVYKLQDKTIQEYISLTNSRIYVRNVESEEYHLIPGNDDDLDNLSTYLTEIQHNVNTLVDKANNILQNTIDFIRLTIEEDEKVITKYVNNIYESISDGEILHLIIMDKDQEQQQQFSIEAYLTSSYPKIQLHIKDEDYLYLIKENNSVRYELPMNGSEEKYRLVHAYISQGRVIE
jgi:hypothetical protein